MKLLLALSAGVILASGIISAVAHGPAKLTVFCFVSGAVAAYRAVTRCSQSKKA